jgi:hypothetical protein
VTFLPISPASTCQSQGGAGLERDSTAAPTPAAPLSQREAVLTSDIPALLTAAYSGYAPAVNGEDTLSCSSPPNFSIGDFMRRWRCLPCSSALRFYADDTGLTTPLSVSVPPAHLQPSSYLPSPKELPRCRLSFLRLFYLSGREVSMVQMRGVTTMGVGWASGEASHLVEPGSSEVLLVH